MLAGLFLDISIIALLVIFIILGIKQGYRGTVLHTIISILLTIAGAVGIGFVTAYFFTESGISEGVNAWSMGIVEGSEFLLDNLGMTAQEIAKWLSFVIFFTIGFLVGLVLVGILLWLFYNLLNKLRNFTWYRIIDNTVAVAINIVVYLSVIMFTLALINCLEGTTILVGLREFLKSTHVTRFFYEIVGKFLSMDMGGETLRETLKIGHFAQLLFG